MNPRVVAPIASAAAAWVTRRSMNSVYARSHDGGIPSNDDTSVPFRRVLFWSLTTALVAALVDVSVQQAVMRWSQKSKQGELPQA